MGHNLCDQPHNPLPIGAPVVYHNVERGIDMSAATEHHAPLISNLDDGRLCPHCLASVDPISHFCDACGGPTSMHSAIDPMGQIYTAGYAYRQATGRPTKFIIVLGIWLICAPALLPLVFVVFGLSHYIFLERGSTGSSFMSMPGVSFGSVAGAMFTLGMTAIYILLLYKTTRAYLRTRREARGLCPDCRYDLRSHRGQPTCPECGCAIQWFEDDECMADDTAQPQT
jgi:hypothetical protein